MGAHGSRPGEGTGAGPWRRWGCWGSWARCRRAGTWAGSWRETASAYVARACWAWCAVGGHGGCIWAFLGTVGHWCAKLRAATGCKRLAGGKEQGWGCLIVVQLLVVVAAAPWNLLHKTVPLCCAVLHHAAPCRAACRRRRRRMRSRECRWRSRPRPPQHRCLAPLRPREGRGAVRDAHRSLCL